MLRGIRVKCKNCGDEYLVRPPHNLDPSQERSDEFEKYCEDFKCSKCDP